MWGLIVSGAFSLLLACWAFLLLLLSAACLSSRNQTQDGGSDVGLSPKHRNDNVDDGGVCDVSCDFAMSAQDIIPRLDPSPTEREKGTWVDRKVPVVVMDRMGHTLARTHPTRVVVKKVISQP